MRQLGDRGRPCLDALRRAGLHDESELSKLLRAAGTLPAFISGTNANDTLNGDGSDNYMMSGKGIDYLSGGLGNDTYLFNQGDGIDTISDYGYASGNADILKFGNGITSDQRWFRQAGNNLEISVIGTEDKAVIENWHSGIACKIEQISTADSLSMARTGPSSA